ncbi:hypothetical protein [Streptomyces smyrnaeus]|uniref:hypothetical protein n=1 Tax=Streptomyces smyrnaeus TaxID=1387713 RepID=UPI00368E43E6
MRRVGVPLVQRTSRRVTLTPVGERLRDGFLPAQRITDARSPVRTPRDGLTRRPRPRNPADHLRRRSPVLARSMTSSFARTGLTAAAESLTVLLPVGTAYLVEQSKTPVRKAIGSLPVADESRDGYKRS